jgi:hypothetical protein
MNLTKQRREQDKPSFYLHHQHVCCVQSAVNVVAYCQYVESVGKEEE